MNDKMKNLLLRTFTGAVLVGAIFGTLFWSPAAFAALAAVILVGGMWEFYSLAGKQGAEPQRVLGITAGAALFVGSLCVFNFVHPVSDALNGVLPFALRYLLSVLPIMLILELFRGRSNPAANLGATVLGIVYVALPMSLIMFIPLLAVGEWEPLALLFVIFTVFANDVFAYLVGMTANAATGGRTHKLFERISPKKTWEGFVGGVAGAVAMGVVAAHVLSADAAVWTGLAVVTALASVAGDLVESMFKRAAGVKDSGRAIPGHGGFLDRFDALLLAVTFVFVYLTFFVENLK